MPEIVQRKLTPAVLFTFAVITAVLFGYWTESWQAALFFFFFEAWVAHLIGWFVYKGKGVL